MIIIILLPPRDHYDLYFKPVGMTSSILFHFSPNSRNRSRTFRDKLSKIDQINDCLLLDVKGSDIDHDIMTLYRI